MNRAIIIFVQKGPQIIELIIFDLPSNQSKWVEIVVYQINYSGEQKTYHGLNGGSRCIKFKENVYLSEEIFEK